MLAKYLTPAYMRIQYHLNFSYEAKTGREECILFISILLVGLLVVIANKYDAIMNKLATPNASCGHLYSYFFLTNILHLGFLVI